MPIDPSEHQLPDMIQPGFLQESERTNSRQRKRSRQGFRIIIEIDQGTFTETGFDKAVGMSVKGSSERLACNGAKKIFGKDFRLEMYH